MLAFHDEGDSSSSDEEEETKGPTIHITLSGVNLSKKRSIENSASDGQESIEPISHALLVPPPENVHDRNQTLQPEMSSKRSDLSGSGGSPQNRQGSKSILPDANSRRSAIRSPRGLSPNVQKEVSSESDGEEQEPKNPLDRLNQVKEISTGSLKSEEELKQKQALQEPSLVFEESKVKPP